MSALPVVSILTIEVQGKTEKRAEEGASSAADTSVQSYSETKLSAGAATILTSQPESKDILKKDEDKREDLTEVKPRSARHQSVRNELAQSASRSISSVSSPQVTYIRRFSAVPVEETEETESTDDEDLSGAEASVEEIDVYVGAANFLPPEPDLGDAVNKEKEKGELTGLVEVEYLGAGNFGQVFKMSGLRKGKKRMFAEKRLSITDPSAKTEQKMLESVTHRHIISYIQSYIKADQMIVLMEFADRGTLTKMVQEASIDPSQEWLFEEHNIWRFISHMSSALNYLHIINILHRDLKPDNILGVTRGGKARLKLADFGTAKLLDEDKVGNFYACTRTGTACYMAPEVLSRWKKYSFGADIFSFGCVVAFFVNRGKHLFPDDSEVKKWQGLRDDVLRLGYSPSLVSVIGSTLDPEHRKRPAARRLLELCTNDNLKVASSSDQSNLDICQS